jgi:glycine hydroxymethyltransferase
MCNNDEYAKKINSAVFPGTQGGPLMHVIAAKAVAFGEALRPEFKDYTKQVVKNAQTLAKTLIKRGLKIVTNGTDNHLMIVDLTPFRVTGKDAEKMLSDVGLTCNKNTIPFDKASPFVTSGIRLGTPAGTTRGFKEKEFEYIGNLIADVLKSLKPQQDVEVTTKDVLLKVKFLTSQFPFYNI